MLVNILKYGIIGTILQLGFYWLMLETIKFTFSLFFVESEREFISDYVIAISIGIFGFILFSQNILSSIFNKEKTTKILSYCSLLLIMFAWSEDLSSWPFKTILCMIISMITIFSKTYIDKFLSRYLVEEKHNE